MRIGVDTGGTFTDIVLVRDDRILTGKLLSTPHDPAEAVLAGIRSLLGQAGEPEPSTFKVVHGSTVATNALLERRGVKAALVTTKRFEDVLEIGRGTRPKLHSLKVRRPPPVIPRHLRFGVEERIAADGSTITALSNEAVESTLDKLRRSGAESVAIVLLHSYASPDHERRIARAIEQRLGLPVTSSHELLPEYREYERTSTCSVNAYVGPRMSGYLSHLESALTELRPSSRLRVMRSDGGTMSARAAGRAAVHTVLSGPAGGVVGGALASTLGPEDIASISHDLGILETPKRLGPGERRTSGDRVDASDRSALAISFDMGGTSTDVCLIGRSLSVTKDAVVGDHPIKVPMLDIHTVGAGGGSVAWRDAGGALRVGPRSAGSAPGPACYGLGGEEPTVTDANMALGRLPPDAKLAGTLPLDEEAAQRALGALGETLGLCARDCAEGIIRIANTVMMRAVRRISLERGHDPRGLALVSFGGAGGLHACELAESLSMPLVLVPRSPGLLSAYGMLAARPERELGRSVLTLLPAEHPGRSTPALADLLSVYEQLQAQVTRDLVGEGIAPEDIEIDWMAELRYRGQSHELKIPFPSHSDGDRASESLAEIIESFHREHEREFGYRLAQGVEWVTARVRCRGPGEPPPAGTAPAGRPLRMEGGTREREGLPAGSMVAGPASLLEYSGTTFVPEGWKATVLSDGTLALAKRMEELS